MAPNTAPRLFLPSSARKVAPTEEIQPRTPSPPPTNTQPVPLRYPESLGTLIEVRETEEKGLGVFALQDSMSF